MRYLIETMPEEAMEIGSKIAEWQRKGKISLIEKGDPVEEIKERIFKIQRAFDHLKKAGIDEEVLVAYIRTKGVSKSAIEGVLYHQKQFFKKLGINT